MKENDNVNTIKMSLTDKEDLTQIIFKVRKGISELNVIMTEVMHLLFSLDLIDGEKIIDLYRK